MSKSRESSEESLPRGRMTAYTFFVQACRNEFKKQNPNVVVNNVEINRRCAEKWKTITDHEKECFRLQANVDKRRFETQLLDYVPPITPQHSTTAKKTGRCKKRRQTKDPNAPKRALSAFFWFCNDKRASVRELYPGRGIGEIAKELGKMWACADLHTKQKYERLAVEDKGRYVREMAEFKKGSS